jgi:hypothetical protein
MQGRENSPRRTVSATIEEPFPAKQDEPP